jgi:hypothetical protein
MDIGDRHSVFVDVPLDLKTVQKPAYINLKNMITNKVGNYIMINGMLVEKPDPKDKSKTRISVKANLSSIGILCGVPIPTNRILLSGVVQKEEGASNYCISTSYRNVKDNTYKSRIIPVSPGSSGSPNNYDKVLVSGRLMAKLPNGEEKVHVQAENLFSFGPLNNKYPSKNKETTGVDFS